MARKNKVILFGRHFAYIEQSLMHEFLKTCRVDNFSAWIRSQVQKEFNLKLVDGTSIDRLDALVSEHFYTDKTDWLRQCMRLAIRQSKGHGIFYTKYLTDEMDPLEQTIMARMSNLDSEASEPRNRE